MSLESATIAISITSEILLRVEPDEDWICYVTQHDDIFGRTYHCGYWMRGMEHDDKLGWLVYEHGGEKAPDKTPAAVLKAWRSGKELPERWHRIDRALAMRAQAEGVRLRGAEWYTDGKADGPFYDCIIQRALFGEEKYG